MIDDRTKVGPVLGIGEAMVEFAPVEGGLFRRGFAGDTLNTAWYLRRLLPEIWPVGYVTRVGTDAVSDEMVGFLAANGLGVDRIGRDGERTVGLYTIALVGAERHFSYWRSASAARRLADDLDGLRASLAGARLVHVSGITLAVVEAAGRRNLFTALAEARAAGTRVSFDPNVRLRLWPDVATLRDAQVEMWSMTDVGLPSFDDETAVWGDADPHAAAARIARYGVGELVVKNGPGAALVRLDDAMVEVAAVTTPDARDTTGAGDSFCAAHLAGRLVGLGPVEACRFAHRLAAEVVRNPGALAPVERIAPFATVLAEAAAETGEPGRAL